MGVCIPTIWGPSPEKGSSMKLPYQSLGELYPPDLEYLLTLCRFANSADEFESMRFKVVGVNIHEPQALDLARGLYIWDEVDETFRTTTEVLDMMPAYEAFWVSQHRRRIYALAS